MEIVVCVKRVPDLSEAELAISKDATKLDDADFTYGINEWDNFAVEAAVQLKEQHGGRVTAISVDHDDDVLRRALAMGVDEAILLDDAAFEGSDPWALATLLRRVIADRPHDLVLCGAISGDGTSGHVGGMLAGLLGLPQVALATGLTVADGKAEVKHEVEGGLERVVELDLPALITVQTGINEPRYVSIRGIRKVASVEIPTKSAADLGLEAAQVGTAGSRVFLEELYMPEAGKGAEILEGDVEAAAATLVERLREHGGL